MIIIPSNACPSCPTPQSQKLYEIPVTPECYCPEPEDTLPLVEFLNPLMLCPCPVVEPFVPNLNPTPRKITRTVVCFGDFIKDITSTKLCETGPKCR